MSGAGDTNVGDRQANEQLPADDLSREARQYESKVQVAKQAQAAQQAERQAARRAEAARRARVLAAGRRVAARQAAAERAAEQHPAPQPSAGAQPKTAQKTTPPAAPSGSPQQVATAMLADFGWPLSEFGCLNELWVRESGWNPSATNPYSGAYGIPQALPGAKMASAGADWATNAATQIKWGLGYIKATYGSPCAAWSHETAYGWY